MKDYTISTKRRKGYELTLDLTSGYDKKFYYFYIWQDEKDEGKWILKLSNKSNIPSPCEFSAIVMNIFSKDKNSCLPDDTVNELIVRLKKDDAGLDEERCPSKKDDTRLDEERCPSEKDPKAHENTIVFKARETTRESVIELFSKRCQIC